MKQECVQGKLTEKYLPFVSKKLVAKLPDRAGSSTRSCVLALIGFHEQNSLQNILTHSKQTTLVCMMNRAKHIPAIYLGGFRSSQQNRGGAHQAYRVVVDKAHRALSLGLGDDAHRYQPHLECQLMLCGGHTKSLGED